jgi:FHA domain
MSLDTFSERLDRAFAARSDAELDELVADVRPAYRLRRALMRITEWLSALDAELGAAWDRPRVEVVALPAEHPGARVTLGRGRSCDWVLAEETVSRRHAELRHDGRRWLLRDLGSRNGTRVNGTRVLSETEVRPGDRVSFGAARYRLASSPGGRR